MSGMSDLLRDFVLETTKKLVDKPEEVKAEVAVSTKSVIIQIKVSKEDYGKIIGKKGRTINALKIITLAIKNTHFPDSRKVAIEVLEDENSPYVKSKGFRAKEE